MSIPGAGDMPSAVPISNRHKINIDPIEPMQEMPGPAEFLDTCLHTCLHAGLSIVLKCMSASAATLTQLVQAPLDLAASRFRASMPGG